MIQTVNLLYIMKNQEVQSDWIDRYHENVLNQAELKKFTGLYEMNGVLRAEVEIDRRLNELLADPETLDFYQKINAVGHKQGRKGHQGLLWLMAASFLVLFTVGALLYLLGKPGPVAGSFDRSQERVQHSGISGTPSQESFPELAIAEKPSIVFGDKVLLPYSAVSSYEVLPELELLVGAHTRTLTFRLQAPAPELQRAVGSEVVYLWENAGSGLSVTITILDNRGQCVMKTKPIEGNSYLLDTGGFQKGLYYWKITVEDELIMLGKLKLN